MVSVVVAPVIVSFLLQAIRSGMNFYLLTCEGSGTTVLLQFFGEQITSRKVLPNKRVTPPPLILFFLHWKIYKFVWCLSSGKVNKEFTYCMKISLNNLEDCS